MATQSFSITLTVYQKMTLGKEVSVPCLRGCHALNTSGRSSEYQGRAWLALSVALPAQDRSRWCWCATFPTSSDTSTLCPLFFLSVLLQLEILWNHRWCFKITFSWLPTVPFHGGDHVSEGVDGETLQHTGHSCFSVCSYFQLQYSSDPAKYLLILTTKSFLVINLLVIY